MTISELLLPELELELETTRAVLARMKDEDAEFKPHEKSFIMAHLAQLVTRLPGWVPMVMNETELDIAPPAGKSKGQPYSIEKVATLLAEFDRNCDVARESIRNATDADYQVPWSFKRAGEVMFTQPRYLALRTSVLNHLVHHRAQLGLYLRMTDQKVPQMYGPTADEGKPNQPK